MGPKKESRRSFDPRRHMQQTQGRLIIGGLALLIIVGGGLVWLLYGGQAAVTAVSCLLVAVGLVGLLWLILALLEKWARADEL